MHVVVQYILYTCSLDAEGAFDAILHIILFHKASAALLKHCWHVMHSWYSRLTVQVKWCGKLSRKISALIPLIPLIRSATSIRQLGHHVVSVHR